MSLNQRILFPIVLLACVSAAGIYWLAQTSMASSAERTRVTDISLEFMARAADMYDQLRDADATLQSVLNMTRLMDVDDAWSHIQSNTASIKDNLDWSAENTGNEEISAAIEATQTALADWVRDAAILMGQEPATQIPTAQKMDRVHQKLENSIANLADTAQFNAGQSSAQSYKDFKTSVTQTSILLGIGLLLTCIGAMLVAQRLSKDISQLSDRLLDLSGANRRDDQNRNVLQSIQQAVNKLETALDERAKLEAIARDAEQSRIETAKAEKQRADEDRLKALQDQQAAEAQAEEQRQRAEQSKRLQTEISRVVHAAGEGTLDAKVAPNFDDDSSNDVANSINKLLETVASSISEAQRTQRKLADGNLTARFAGTHKGIFASLQSDINQTAEQFQDAMHQIAGSARAIFDDADGISKVATTLAERTEQAAETSQSTTEAVHNVSLAATEMATNALESRDLVSASIQDVESSEESMQKAMLTIDEIASYSTKISEVVGVINDIAFQTNLLALNAGVEAARAGDAGSGFAVVASEVRALAQRSSDSASEIEKLIHSSGTCVENGVIVVKQTGDALRTVARSVKEVSERVAKIADDARVQSTDIKHVQDSLAKIDTATQQNAAMFEETTAASQSLTNSANGLAALADRFETAPKSEPDNTWRASA